MAAEQMVLPGFHEPGLVVLSVLISILGAYAARDLIERLRDESRRRSSAPLNLPLRG
jgi:NO-binding membrane sensor protein with MHYT domain